MASTKFCITSSRGTQAGKKVIQRSSEREDQASLQSLLIGELKREGKGLTSLSALKTLGNPDGRDVFDVHRCQIKIKT